MRLLKTWPMALVAVSLLAGSLRAGERDVEPALGQRLREMARRVERDPELQKKIAPMLAEARRVRDLPLVCRATSLEQLKNPPKDKRFGGIDARTYVVTKTDARKAELFSLASADLDATSIIAREMPLLAAAYVITGDTSFADRVNAQLREIASWKPLQRPGWMLYTAANSLPPDGDDGVWLSTGVGLIAICQTLEIMPEAAIPAEIRKEVRAQLSDECARVVSDWKKKKGWFVRQHVPTTNQWVVPSCGLAVAAATLGRDANPEAYELGVKNLEDTLGTLGSDGGSPEGLEYGTHFTAAYLYLASHAFRLAGDDRFAQQPFLKHFPTWECANYQPAQTVVNTFDSFGASRNMYPTKAPDVAQIAVLSRSPMVMWLLREQIRVNALSMYGLLAAGVPDSELKEPPLWGSFDTARCVMWRDSWKDEASGVWVRGGHERDGHDHWDRGHVNFIAGGKIVLLEAGTAGYDSPIKRDVYDSVRGHNVLQVGEDLFPKKSAAPITISQLDAAGGDVTVEAGAGYPQVKTWRRRVVWSAKQMEITDRVELKAPDTVLFRWHLGSQQALSIEPAGATAASAHLPAGTETFRGWNGNLASGFDWTPPEKDVVQTPEATFAVSADAPMVCEQEKNLDHTMKFRVQKHEHATLVVRSAAPVSEMTVKTVIRVP